MSKYISDVIGDIDEIIRQHGNKILIAAGVGAGKTYWVKRVLAKQGSVLFITSRRAKVDEDENDSRFERLEGLDTSAPHSIATNAGIENLCKLCYLNGIELSEQIGQFKYIVVDEIHSIAVDSSFARSSFALEAFIRYATEHGKIVIGMTGTPEPMRQYFGYNDWHFIDLREKCRYVRPDKIDLIEKTDIPNVIQNSLNRKKRIVYFINMASEIGGLITSVLSDTDLTIKQISVIVGTNARLTLEDDLKDALGNKARKVTEQSKDTYQSIINDKKIPESCRLLICTSAMREGIDIENDDCEIICENHILTNIIQFFGRVRIGGGTAHIVVDAKQHRVIHDVMAYHYASNMAFSETKNLNNYLRSIRSTRRYSEIEDYSIENNGTVERNLGAEDILKFADFIESGNPYIRFDYTKACFSYFLIKFREEKRIIYKLQRRNHEDPEWKKDLKQYCNEYRIKLVDVAGNRQAQERHQMLVKLEEFTALEIHFYTRIRQGDPIENQIVIKKNDIIIDLINNALNRENRKWRQYSEINEHLIDAGIPYQIVSARENRGLMRGKSYWKIVRVN